MDDIARFFVKSKKRDLSNESKTSEDPKKVKESGSASLSDECDFSPKVKGMKIVEQSFLIV